MIPINAFRRPTYRGFIATLESEVHVDRLKTALDEGHVFEIPKFMRPDSLRSRQTISIKTSKQGHMEGVGFATMFGAAVLGILIGNTLEGE